MPPKKIEKMSTQVLLATSGLGEYFRYFEKSGHKMFDANSHASDLLVEKIILETESRCCITFHSDVRVKIWKAFRYQWFRGPGHSLPFIERTEVPDIMLPPKDWVENDSKVKFNDLESDRQRQVVRKTKQTAPGESGSALQTYQFEVYKRDIDILYEYKDLERCVQEWEKRNPRAMVQEDYREEVIRLRLKNVIDFSNSNISVRKGKTAALQQSANIVFGVQLLTGAACFIMMFIAYTQYSAAPPELFMSFFISSKQVISSVSFFIAMMVANVVRARLKGDPLIRQLRKTVLNCERLMERISDFRIATESLRLSRGEMKASKQQNVDRRKAIEQDKDKEAKAGRKVRQRSGGKRKKKQDPTLALWCPDAGVLDAKEITVIQKQLTHSFKRLEALPDDFRRSGGDRMIGFKDRLGGVVEDDLCIVSSTVSKVDKKRNRLDEAAAAKKFAALPALPPAPPALAIQSLQRNALLPPVPAVPQLPRRALPLLPPPLPPMSGGGGVDERLPLLRDDASSDLRDAGRGNDQQIPWAPAGAGPPLRTSARDATDLLPGVIPRADESGVRQI